MRIALLLISDSALCACAGVPRSAAQLDQLESATITGIQNARYWGDELPVLMDASERAAALRAEGLQASGQAEAALQ